MRHTPHFVHIAAFLVFCQTAWAAGTGASVAADVDQLMPLSLLELINLPVVKFSVDWWNTLHQGTSTLFAAPEDRLPAVYLWPWALMTLAYLSAFGSLWLVRIRALVWRRRARALALRMAES